MKRIPAVLILAFCQLGLARLSLAGPVRAGLSIHSYFVEDSIYREVYGRANLMFGTHFSFELGPAIELRAELGYSRDRGKMTLSRENIVFDIFMPEVLGARIKIPGNGRVSPYAGGGGGVLLYRENLPPRFDDTSGAKAFWHIESGLDVKISPRITLDLNVRYIKASVHSEDQITRLGGISAGIALGYHFLR